MGGFGAWIRGLGGMGWGVEQGESGNDCYCGFAHRVSSLGLKVLLQ
jgi:hypothetical protein